MDVGGLPQLFISRLSSVDSIPGVQMNRLDLVHLVDYPIALSPINKYHILSLVKDYSSREVVLLSLFSPGDAYYFDVERSPREDILFAHEDGSGVRTKIFLKRILQNVEVVGYIREPIESGDNGRFTGSSIITAVRDANGFKWVVRDQFALKSVIYRCVAQTTHDFFMNILYNRRQKLIDGIMRVKNAAFYYPIASNAPEFKLKQGSVVVLARRGWLCSLRVTTDGRLQVLLERLARTFPCHPAGCTVRSEKEQLFLMSATGEETIVIFSGKKQLKYHIYYTHPSVHTNFICHKLDRNEMTVIPSITGRIQGADFDATSKTLHIFKERDKAYALTLKGGKVKDYRPGLDLTDHFTGRTHGYSSAPHELPWQTDEGRQLKRDQKGIHLITDDGKRGKKSWVLATTSSDAVDYMMLFMPHTINPLPRYFGAVKCTIFIVDDLERFSEFTRTSNGCASDKEVRMFMEYSKDFGHPGSRLTIIRKDSSQLATVLQDVIFIPYGQKKLIFDFDEEKFQTKLTIDIEEGSFNLVHVRENEVHYKMPQKHTDLCVLKFGKKRIEQEAQEETYSLPIASITGARNATQCGKVQLIHILYQFNRGNVIYFIIDGGRPSVASSDKALVRRLRGFSNSLFSDGRIPTSFVTDFLLLRERKDLFTQYNINGKMSQPGTFKVNEDIRFLAIYDGFLFSGSNEGQYKCILESECKRGGNLLRKDVTVAAVTEAADQEVFAAFTDPPPVQYESGTGQRDGKECPLTRSPYFVQLMLKVMLVDISLTLALTVTVLVHRMHVIPARRRYKIVAHLLKQKKKRALKDRTARRLRRLSFLRRRLRRIAKQSDNSSSSGTETKTTNLVTAAANRIMNGNMTGIPPITSTATHVRGFNQLKGTEA